MLLKQSAGKYVKSLDNEHGTFLSKAFMEVKSFCKTASLLIQPFSELSAIVKNIARGALNPETDVK